MGSSLVALGNGPPLETPPGVRAQVTHPGAATSRKRPWGSGGPAHEAFLTAGSRKHAGGSVKASGDETAGAAGRDDGLVEEEPLVGADGAVEPYGMVQAGPFEAGILPAVAVRQHDVVNEGAVGHVGEGGGVQGGVVVERSVDAQPHALVFGDGFALGSGWRVDVADFECARVAGPDATVVGAEVVGELVVGDGDCLRGRGVGHARTAVFESVLRDVKGGDEANELTSVLCGADSAGAERASVADGIDREVDGVVGISRAEEVAVERMVGAIGVDSALFSSERLREELAAVAAVAAFGSDGGDEVFIVDGVERNDLGEGAVQVAPPVGWRGTRRERISRAGSPSVPS